MTASHTFNSLVQQLGYETSGPCARDALDRLEEQLATPLHPQQRDLLLTTGSGVLSGLLQLVARKNADMVVIQTVLTPAAILRERESVTANIGPTAVPFALDPSGIVITIDAHTGVLHLEDIECDQRVVLAPSLDQLLEGYLAELGND
jgi:hypothetical protein